MQSGIRAKAKAQTIRRPVITPVIADRAASSIFFLWATALSAYVYLPVPGTPVPITLQTFFVLLAGALLRRGDSVLTMGAYVLLGVLGLPFFAAGGAGLAYFQGVTAGYLVGFIAAAAVIGRLLSLGPTGKEPTVPHIIGALGAGIMIIYLCGSVWLSIILPLSLADAWRIGALPFVAADVLKVVAAAGIVRLCIRWRARWLR